MRKSSVSGGIGTISSRLYAEGPIKRNKSSYLIGGRVSYCNWLIKATDNIDLQNSSANFYDVTAKVFQTINKNNFLTVSIYNSYDAFNLATDSVFSWGIKTTHLNGITSIRKNSFLSQRCE